MYALSHVHCFLRVNHWGSQEVSERFRLLLHPGAKTFRTLIASWILMAMYSADWSTDPLLIVHEVTKTMHLPLTHDGYEDTKASESPWIPDVRSLAPPAGRYVATGLDLCFSGATLFSFFFFFFRRVRLSQTREFTLWFGWWCQIGCYFQPLLEMIEPTNW